MLRELRAEDAGEVRFQAGAAQSAAELEVEGKPLPRGWPGAGLAGRRLALGARPAPHLPFSRGSPGAGHRGQRAVSGRGRDLGLRVQRNGPLALRSETRSREALRGGKMRFSSWGGGPACPC